MNFANYKSRAISVKELISLLSRIDGDSMVTVEGCDCIGECIGISTYREDGKPAVTIRRKGGLCSGEETFPLISPDVSTLNNEET
jgi:hypothetical protein